MGHEYVKESETFNVNRNGTVPKPTQQDISDGKVLKADGTWGAGGGGSGEVADVLVNGTSVVDENHNAQIVSYKEVTQAEYNALPESKETDGVLYCIKDVGGADSFPPLIYSDTEREIGVWRDGKPLYQKVFSLNNAEIQVDTFYEIPNTDKTQYDTYVYCYLIDSYGQAWCATVGFSGNKLAVFVHSNRTRSYNYAIVQYTKSADTAGSGTWTTQGGYAHHYSTSEKVIGTWIDGKPLYEKTVSFGAIAANTINYQLDCSILTVDNLIDINCMTYSDNTFIKLPLALFQQGSTYSDYGINIQAFDKTTGKVRIDTGASRSISGGYITIQYTKTTD